MTVVENLTREQVRAEQRALVKDVRARMGTTDRQSLRDLSLRGRLSDRDMEAVDRLEVLDYLMSDR